MVSDRTELDYTTWCQNSWVKTEHHNRILWWPGIPDSDQWQKTENMLYKKKVILSFSYLTFIYYSFIHHISINTLKLFSHMQNQAFHYFTWEILILSWCVKKGMSTREALGHLLGIWGLRLICSCEATTQSSAGGLLARLSHSSLTSQSGRHHRVVDRQQLGDVARGCVHVFGGTASNSLTHEITIVNFPPNVFIWTN